MKQTAILIIALLCMQSLCIEMEVEVKKSPEQLLVQLKESRWGSLAYNLLEMQLRTNGPLEELITAFRNLWNNLNFKIQSEQEDYRRNKEEHLVVKGDAQERQTNAAVRIGVSNTKLEQTLYPERSVLEQTVEDTETLIRESEKTITDAEAERKKSQELFEEEKWKFDQAIDAVKECIALIKGLQSGTGTLADISFAKTNAKGLLNNLKIKHNPNLDLVKTLFQLLQNFADKSATQKVLDLFDELLNDFIAQGETLVFNNNAEIEIFNTVVETNEEIIRQAQIRLAQAQSDLAKVNKKIEEEKKRLETAQADKIQADADFQAEETRWAAEVAAHEDLLAELKSELDALSQCIDLFSSPEMQEVGDEMLDRLNQSG